MQKLMMIMAHPDDAEFCAAGLMLRWVKSGGNVNILCLTDGSAGHHQLSRAALAARRRDEALAAATLLGAQLNVWPVPDGELEATVAHRHGLIRDIRRYAPDLVVTHRLADYHPDHRATAQLVQDACYLLQVPNIVPDTPALPAIPPVLMAADLFTYPRPARADWVLDTSSVVDEAVALLHCHASQVYEWLPHTYNIEVPANDRRTWLKRWYAARPEKTAKRHNPAFTFAEAFEISEYGGRFTPPTLT